jgi:hypothetical protein
MMLPTEPADDTTLCALCAAPLGVTPGAGCTRGGCVQQPGPTRFYAVRRACVEYQRMILDDGHTHRFFTG